MTSQKPAPKRMGRPPKAPEKGKRQNYTFRMSDTDRDKVIAAAERAGRSISEEIEKRVEDSFKQPELIEATSRAAAEAVASSTMWLFESLFGGKEGLQFGRMMGYALRNGMDDAGYRLEDLKKLKDDLRAFAIVERCVHERASEWLSSGTVDPDTLRITYEAFAQGVSKATPS